MMFNKKNLTIKMASNKDLTFLSRQYPSQKINKLIISDERNRKHVIDPKIVEYSDLLQSYIKNLYLEEDLEPLNEELSFDVTDSIMDNINTTLELMKGSIALKILFPGQYIEQIILINAKTKEEYKMDPRIVDYSGTILSALADFPPEIVEGIIKIPLSFGKNEFIDINIKFINRWLGLYPTPIGFKYDPDRGFVPTITNDDMVRLANPNLDSSKRIRRGVPLEREINRMNTNTPDYDNFGQSFKDLTPKIQKLLEILSENPEQAAMLANLLDTLEITSMLYHVLIFFTYNIQNLTGKEMIEGGWIKEGPHPEDDPLSGDNLIDQNRYIHFDNFPR